MPRRTTTVSATPKKLRQQTLQGYIQSSSSPVAPSPKKPLTNSRKRRVKSPSPQSEDNNESDVGAIHFEPQVIDLTSDLSSSNRDEDEEDDDSPHRPTASRLKNKIESSASSDESDTWASSSRVDKKGKGRLRRRSDSSEPEDHTPIKKRRLVQRLQEDDDDGDLIDDLDKNRIMDARFRARDKKSEFQKNLEKLKRKKRGQAISESSSSEEEEDSKSDESSNLDATMYPLFEGARPDNGDDSQSLENDSFIVEDAGTEVIPNLPAAFSMNTHQDLAHHFKIICQLFVHLAVRLPRERGDFMREVTSSEDGYFYTPLVITRRKLSGLRDSLVASSIWRIGFRNALERYPDLELSTMQISLPACDACHLGGRVSTILGRLGGLAYDRLSFEPLYDSDDSDDDSDEEKSESEITQKEFHLGRFCARRTMVFHRFSHWEHTLFRNLSREVEELRETKTSGFVKVAYARGIKPPEDDSDADGIMDWLDQRGIIAMEWQVLKDMMNRARSLDAKGEDDDD